MDKNRIIILALVVLIIALLVGIFAVMPNMEKMDKDPGEYEITITYGGNDKYNGCNATKKITIDEEVVEATTSQSDNSDSSSRDSEREEYKTTSDGWNPGDHEVSRESIGDGNERVRYDDGYFRIVDQEGDIVTYGWA